MTDDLVDRLRGIYRVPTDDGGEFVRQFETSAICHEAANRIETLIEAMRMDNMLIDSLFAELSEKS